ncbi:MAG: hypothetical protein WAT93_14655 [Pontixanthobacter sp.]
MLSVSRTAASRALALLIGGITLSSASFPAFAHESANHAEAAWMSGAECIAKMKESSSPIKNTLDGYWTNDANVVVGKWKFSSINFFGIAEDNTQQITMDIGDITSPQNTNELGQNYSENSDRVIFSQCHFDGGSITLKGSGEQAGPVELSGDFNVEGNQYSLSDNPTQAHDIFIGNLTIGSETKSVVLGFFIGD